MVALGLLVPLLGLPARGDDPLDPYLGDPGRALPNLVPNVEELRVETFRSLGDFTIEDGLFLWFDTHAQNLAAVPLQLTIDEIDSPQSTTVSQCLSWRAAQVCRETVPVGGFTWHEAHKHFHYEEFASYELRRLAADGRPDYSATGLLGVSEKVSFCLADSRQVRTDARPTPFYTTCEPTVQGISPGWTDIYDATYPGQNFSIAGLVDGRYALVVDLDYGNDLHETDDTDNVVEVTVELSGGLSQATIVGRRWPAPDDRGTPTTTSTTTKKKPKKDKR